MALSQKQITDLFQAQLGRAPTQNELGYFSQMGQGTNGVGGMSAYEAEQAVGATPEAQLSTLGKYTDLYSQQLGKYDNQMLGQAQNQLMGQFRQLGRANSTGYINAFAQAAQNLAMNRQSQMAQFYGQGLGGAMQSQVGAGQGALGRSYGLQENERQFSRDKTLAQLNYDRQSDFYNTQSRRGFQQGLIGMGAQIGMGAIAGGIMASDSRIKKNVEPMAKVGDLTLYSYNFKSGKGPSGRYIGFMAQDVKEKYPDSVIEINGVLHIKTDTLATHLRG